MREKKNDSVFHPKFLKLRKFFVHGLNFKVEKFITVIKCLQPSRTIKSHLSLILESW